MRIGPFNIHRKEQWDMDDVKPWICVHMWYDHGNGCKRIFCLSRKGVYIRGVWE